MLRGNDCIASVCGWTALKRMRAVRASSRGFLCFSAALEASGIPAAFPPSTPAAGTVACGVFRDMGDACLDAVAVVGAVGAVEVHVLRLHEAGLVREHLAVPFSREVGVRRLAMREHARLARHRMRRQRVSDRVLTAQSAARVAHCHHARLAGTGRSRVLDGAPPILSPSATSRHLPAASQLSLFCNTPRAG